MGRIVFGKGLTPGAVEALKADQAIYARSNFWAFRQAMDKHLLKGWFHRELASHLHRFYLDLKEGKRPKLVLTTPPQHGKSRAVRDFLAWVAGQDPDLKTMFTTYSNELAVSANLAMQRTITLPAYMAAFPGTQIAGEQGPTRWQRNTSILEFVGHHGSFRNTTVAGQITGFGFDLGVVDDPLKGRQEAQSKLVRDSIWLWLTDDFFSRFADHAGLIIIMTRWHVDDMVGRFLLRFPHAKVLNFPAIAVQDELYRFRGEALFPEHKSLEFLLERKQLMTASSWESLYQQNPTIIGGGLFPIENFTIDPVRPLPPQIKKSVRYWDKAGTKDGGSYTCGVLLHIMKDGHAVISDVRRGQWSALERETRIKQTAQMDRAEGYHVEVWVEQEPGSGGLESAERTILNLRGFNAKKDKVTGSKEVRCEPYAAQVQASNVHLVEGEWNRDFIDEHEVFPNGAYKDQVDAAGGAFMKATASKYGSYVSDMSWVGGPMGRSIEEHMKQTGAPDAKG